MSVLLFTVAQTQTIAVDCTIASGQAQSAAGDTDRSFDSTITSSQSQSASGTLEAGITIDCTVTSSQSQSSTGSLERWLDALVQSSQSQSSALTSSGLAYTLLQTLPETVDSTISYIANRADAPYLNFLYTNLKLEGETMSQFTQRFIKTTALKSWVNLKVSEVSQTFRANMEAQRVEAEVFINE